MRKKIYVILLVFGGFLFCGSAVSAQTINFSPQTATKKVGEELSIDINIDTNGQSVSAADIIFSFDPEIVEIESVTMGTSENGGFFPKGSYTMSGSKIYIGGFIGESYDVKSGTGRVASMAIKGKKVGSGQLVFACTTQTNDTNILNAQSADIINCTGTQNGTYTFVADSGTSPTNTPAPGSPTTAPAVPVSGMSLPTIFSFGFGALMMFVGLVFLF